MNSVGVDCEIRTIQGFSLWSSDKDRSEMILRYELSRTLHGLCLWSWDKDRIKQLLRWETIENYRSFPFVDLELRRNMDLRLLPEDVLV